MKTKSQTLFLFFSTVRNGNVQMGNDERKREGGKSHEYEGMGSRCEVKTNLRGKETTCPPMYLLHPTSTTMPPTNRRATGPPGCTDLLSRPSICTITFLPASAIIPYYILHYLEPPKLSSRNPSMLLHGRDGDGGGDARKRKQQAIAVGGQQQQHQQARADNSNGVSLLFSLTITTCPEPNQDATQADAPLRIPALPNPASLS